MASEALGLEPSVAGCIAFSALGGALEVMSTMVLAYPEHRAKQGRPFSKCFMRGAVVVNLLMMLVASVAYIVGSWYGPVSLSVPVVMASKLLFNLVIVGTVLKMENFSKDQRVGTYVIALSIFSLPEVGPQPVASQDVLALLRLPLSIAWSITLGATMAITILAMIVLVVSRRRKGSDAKPPPVEADAARTGDRSGDERRDRDERGQGVRRRRRQHRRCMPRHHRPDRGRQRRLPHDGRCLVQPRHLRAPADMCDARRQHGDGPDDLGGSEDDHAVGRLLLPVRAHGAGHLSHGKRRCPRDVQEAEARGHRAADDLDGIAKQHRSAVGAASESDAPPEEGAGTNTADGPDADKSHGSIWISMLRAHDLVGKGKAEDASKFKSIAMAAMASKSQVHVDRNVSTGSTSAAYHIKPEAVQVHVE